MKKPLYQLAKNGEFVIKNYNAAPTFSSFLPGIAGVFGCPMWAFYANRGQCITSAGVQDKNGAIIEFQPANKAYRRVSLDGYRTFIKVDGKFYEPFSERTDLPREMRIAPEGLKLGETNPELKLRVEVTYFTIAEESFPGLARIVRLTNLAEKKRQIEILDGLTTMIPYGFDNDLLKKISQTIEAWCTVENPNDGAPFCRLKVLPSDAAETKFVEKGNFFFAIAHQQGKDAPATLIVDPAVLFGENSSLELPARFLANKNFTVPRHQQAEGFTPCAFAHKKMLLPGKGVAEICSLIGQIDNLDSLHELKKKITRDFFSKKEAANRSLIAEISDRVATRSSSPHFDLYSRYTFLDNVMRGGLPLSFDGKVFYAYYRKHGDMERDYNDFKLMPTYFSQGNGNYRDINQNRRNDIFFNPRVNAHNVRRFFNLIQLDGFNPLVVFGSKYSLRSREEGEALIKKHLTAAPAGLAEQLTRPFLVGELLKGLENLEIHYRLGRQEFAEELLEKATAEEGAIHGEGFWIDHFSYNLDLLESFAALFPEKLATLLFNEPVFTFYDNDHFVLPRQQKYSLVGGQVRQYRSVVVDQEKQALINSRPTEKNLVRTEFGRGQVYRTTLATKILLLIANKAASFDAAGIGLEMEADKPDWYDALNGLPGLLGSSLSETLELKRLARYFKEQLPADQEILLPVELAEFITALSPLLKKEVDHYVYWDQATTAKEAFREKTRLGISGNQVVLGGKELSVFLNGVIDKCSTGVALSLKNYGNYYTYFINEAVGYELLPGGQIKVKKFRQKPLPLFLEGFVHALKVEQDKKIPQLVRRSPLYDKKLKMYKVNAPLAEAPVEIGRARIFTPGWLENESIWLHMEYKYMLELLKAGLYEDFFADLKNVLIPFLDPAIYKRSILENSSFIVSSANPNPNNHGRGFVARLSGAAAEFVDLWLIMMTGKKIFSLDEKGLLTFRLAPLLPAWLFDKKGEITFTLLGQIPVTLINKKRKNTYGKNGVRPVSYKITLDDREIVFDSAEIKEPYAQLIREQKVSRIVVTLG